MFYSDSLRQLGNRDQVIRENEVVIGVYGNYGRGEIFNLCTFGLIVKVTESVNHLI